MEPQPIFRFRTDPETARHIREDAEMAGLSVGRYLRQKMQGKQISSKYDVRLYNQIRSQGGLLVKLISEGHRDLTPTLNEIRKTLKLIQQSIKGEV